MFVRQRSVVGAILCALWGCHHRGTAFEVVDTSYAVAPGTLGVVMGDTDEVTGGICLALEAYLRTHGRFTLLSHKDIASRWPKYPSRVPIASAGRYHEQVLLPERANSSAARGILDRLGSKYVMIVWAGPLQQITQTHSHGRYGTSTSSYITSTIHAQLYEERVGEPLLVGYTKYELLAAGPWACSTPTSTATVDRMIDDGAREIGDALLQKLALGRPGSS